MTKEPWKDPRPMLPRRQLFVPYVDDHQSSAVARHPDHERIKQAKSALDMAKAKRGNGPKKGSGGRPPKAGAVSKRTQFRRHKKEK